jgi:hypothetical protein
LDEYGTVFPKSWLPPEPNRDLPGFNRALFPLS